jgi:hypothetical protein
MNKTKEMDWIRRSYQMQRLILRMSYTSNATFDRDRQRSIELDFKVRGTKNFVSGKLKPYHEKNKDTYELVLSMLNKSCIQ